MNSLLSKFSLDDLLNYSMVEVDYLGEKYLEDINEKQIDFDELLNDYDSLDATYDRLKEDYDKLKESILEKNSSDKEE